MKVRLKQPIPEHLDEMQEAEQFVKEVEDSLGQWALRLGKLSSMKTDLSQYIITDDVLLLQEQVDHLHGQWEELCLKVSLRKQEIADRLNAWIIFNEKNRELCEWLTQMENKVAHSTELSIEDMVEKLKKDCMEEINLFSENKTHLKQLGEQLISASDKTKETEINDKLKDINDRWQHLFDHIESRVRKLKETLVTVQQLDKNMSNLRTWLSRIEAELAKPVVYSVCHNDEIQRKLAEQQDLQRDIEQHTEGVASVLTLCDVLLHDADACGTDLENDSIKQTTHSLDRRWRNICAMSMERRMRIEETWRLWCKFLDDYSRFEDWLRVAERTAANPATTDTLYTSAKEELKKFEAFQRQVHERLTQLELVNKQYRRLAREKRTDGASKLKIMVHEGNQRWDQLQRRVTAILRRLKYFTSQREEFEGTRESILVWLTEMDLQLTNVEHFSESDIHDKMRQLNAFQQEITLNTNKIDALIVFGETLIQRSAPLDAVLIEDELEELHSYCQEVFGRVARFHQRLTTRRPVLEEEAELSDLEESGELGGAWGDEKDEDESLPGEGPATAAARQVCHLLAPPLEQSGRETPVSVDSIPLEWDHTVDVGGSSSHEEEEDATYYSALSEVEVTESSEAFQRATARALGSRPVDKAEVTWHLSPDPHHRKRETHTHTHTIHSLGSSTHTSTPFHTPGYVRLMSECSGTIDRVKRVELLLSDDELLEPGLKAVNSPEKQPGVIERWELHQACGAPGLQEGGERWLVLQDQLSSLGLWLRAVLPELQHTHTLQPQTSLACMEQHIRKLKEMQKTFSSYKAQMISINLIGRELLGGQDLQSTASDELKELHENLRSTNQKWTQACAALDRWESRLHKALMQCQEFHESLHSMLLWLAQVEKRRFNINIHDHTLHRGALEAHQHTLKSVELELQQRQQEVRPLVAVCGELLLEAEGEEVLEAREKVHVVNNRLRLLLRHVQRDLSVLQARLDACTLGSSVDPTEDDQTCGASPKHKAVEGQSAIERGPAASTSCEKASGSVASSSASRPFLQRVLRAALPLHLLLLLLLVLTCLVPLSQDDYSCALTNNFARSFYPMLRYTNGPPPT
ncbi:nesprin-2-like isoform X1 [Alosa pseudoharengus]|uniref:nesprin-2-like isoform X1 n=1 Tax=Alosa pseudoharengus TaxID=34774 RepID=UPI003F88B192